MFIFWKPNHGPRNKWASVTKFVIHLYHVLLTCNNVFLWCHQHTRSTVNKIKWIQEKACQKDFFSHDSFNGSWRPSNRLPASAAHGSCEEWIQWGGSELYLSHMILHIIMINKSTHVHLCNSLFVFVDMEKGLVGCTTQLPAANWLLPKHKPQSHFLLA